MSKKILHSCMAHFLTSCKLTFNHTGEINSSYKKFPDTLFSKSTVYNFNYQIPLCYVLSSCNVLPFLLNFRYITIWFEGGLQHVIKLHTFFCYIIYKSLYKTLLSHIQGICSKMQEMLSKI